jgi:hypothetical protein
MDERISSLVGNSQVTAAKLRIVFPLGGLTVWFTYGQIEV